MMTRAEFDGPCYTSHRLPDNFTVYTVDPNVELVPLPMRQRVRIRGTSIEFLTASPPAREP